MAGSLNKVMLIGRLGQDPKLTYTQGGSPVANFSMATDESFTDKSGQKQERTEWHRVVVWNRQAEMVANYLSKGRLVFVEGKLQTREWEDQNGQKRYTTEVVAILVHFLDRAPEAGDPSQACEDAPGRTEGGRGKGEQGKATRPRPGASSQASRGSAEGPGFVDEASDMDDLPF